jgi:hypothetical protein
LTTLVDERIKKSRQQEARGASLHGGSRNSGSGNGPWRKNDVRVEDEYLIEYKRTDKKQITIKSKELEDLRTNALLEGRTPLWGIEIGGRDWTLIESSEFESLRRGTGARDGGRLDAREVRGAGPRDDVPAERAGVQEAASGSQGHLSRSRRPQRLPPAGDVS